MNQTEALKYERGLALDDCGGEDRGEGGDFAVVVRWNDCFTGFASPLTDERSNR